MQQHFYAGGNRFFYQDVCQQDHFGGLYAEIALNQELVPILRLSGSYFGLKTPKISGGGAQKLQKGPFSKKKLIENGLFVEF